MRHLARVARFGVETFEQRGIPCKRRRKEFQGHRLAEFEVVGAVDFTHAAAHQQADDPEALGEHDPRGKSAAVGTGVAVPAGPAPAAGEGGTVGICESELVVGAPHDEQNRADSASSVAQ